MRHVFISHHPGDVDLQRSIHQPLPKEVGGEGVRGESVHDFLSFGLRVHPVSNQQRKSGENVPYLMGCLVVTANEADPTVDELHIPDVPSRCISKVMGRNLGGTARATGRDVHGTEEEAAEVRELLQQLETCGRFVAEPVVPSVDDVLVPEAFVVHDDIQHRISDSNKAVPGEVCEEEVDVRVVGFVARELRKSDLETVVGVGETLCDLTFQAADLFQESSVHVTDVVQPNDHVV